jgi:hypothetical protein
MHVYPASGEESSENRGLKPRNANEELGQETSNAPLIHCIRGFRVILDTDLARLYRVETRALNQAVKRNREKFPAQLRKRYDVHRATRPDPCLDGIDRVAGRGSIRSLPAGAMKEVQSGGTLPDGDPIDALREMPAPPAQRSAIELDQSPNVEWDIRQQLQPARELFQVVVLHAGHIGLGMPAACQRGVVMRAQIQLRRQDYRPRRDIQPVASRWQRRRQTDE